MNNKNELFGDFMSAAPNIPPPSIPISQQSPTLNQLSQSTNPYRDIIDNNTLYKKLLDIEFEISTIKAIVSAIPNNRPIYYPQTQIQQPPFQVQGNITNQNIPTVWTNSNFSVFKTNQSSGIWKDNQTQFK